MEQILKLRSEYLHVPVLPSIEATDVAFADHCCPEMAVPAHYDTGLGVAFTDKYLSKAHSHQAAIHLTAEFRKYTAE